MKKSTKLFQALVILFISLNMFGQYTLTSGGSFFKAADRFGNDLPFENLQLTTNRPPGGSGNVIASAPYLGCSAGYFDLYFEAGSYFDQNAQAANVLCQVFKDISAFLPSPLSAPTNTVRINIYCGNTPSGSPGALGTASGVYVFPMQPVNPNQTILDNQIYKAIISGINPYSSLTIGYLVNATDFYHGYVKANPSPSAGSWNLSLTTSTITSSQFDFYTVMLHEVTHALGFASLIGPNGASILPAGNNYFARYDQYLKSYTGAALIGSSTPSCNTTNLTYQGLVNYVNPGACTSTTNLGITTCSAAAQYSSSNVNVKVYTPNCFEVGSSLSHFEDMCTVPGGFTTVCTATPALSNNNLYYVMSDAQSLGSCYVKRYLRPEERFVLCDIGYSVTATYPSTVAGANYTYSAGACNANTPVWADNDGFANGAFTFTSTGTTINIPITTSIITNDSPNTTTISCVEAMTGNGTASIVGGNLSVTITSGTGLVLVRYLPKTSGGIVGSPAYVFVYFVTNGCASTNPCNMVQNPSFESLGSPAGCGLSGTGAGIGSIDCWDQYSITGSWMYGRSCNGPYSMFALGSNSNPTIESFNGTPNDHIVNLYCGPNGTSGTFSSPMKNNLSVALVPTQTYQVSFWVMNSPAHNYYLVANDPVVITIASMPNFNVPYAPSYPNTLNIIKEFTVNPSSAWSLITQTFVFAPTPSVNHDVLIIGLNPTKTMSLTSFSANRYCFIDELNLAPAPAATFAIPQGTVCGAPTYTNLAQFASPIPGTFTGAGVSAITTTAGTRYVFTGSSVAPGNYYPIAFTYTTGGCSNTIYQTIPVPGIKPSNCSDGYTLTGIGFGAGTTYTWMPGNATTSVIAVTPTTASTYSLSMKNGTCQITYTVTLSPCCPMNAPNQYTSSVISNTVAGTITFTNNVTVPTGTTVTLLGADLMFGPGVNITVNNGGYLKILGSHLYSCGSTLWKGIVVNDGGRVITDAHPTTDYSSLIEDAAIAIDISNHATSTYTDVLVAKKTVFNRNYVGINISSYTRTLAAYPFSISKTVFTSRSYTSSTTQWVQVASLRAATATTLTSSPYLMAGGSVSNIKIPFDNQPSQAGIKLSDVGLTSGSTFYSILIGNINSGEFNIVDAHRSGIFSSNSNLVVNNDVFQNTQYTVNATGAGSGIYHEATTNMNTKLDLTPTNSFVPLFFYDCHKGVEGKNVYRFNMEKAKFSSSQTATNTAYGQGNTGLLLTTNRFQYYIKDNLFTNINNCINIPVTPGPTTLVVASCSICVPYGIYAANISVINNTFTPGAVAGNYLGKAVNLTVPVGAAMTIASNGNVSPYVVGAVIQGNKLDQVYRGIYVDGFVKYQATAASNTLTLIQDNNNPNNTGQHGIDFSNTIGSINSYGRSVINGNDLSGIGTNSLTNNLASLVYCADNSGVLTPSVTCNDLHESYNGFTFYGSNIGTQWSANNMKELKRGMLLTDNGKIGQQGTGSIGMGNNWNGTWTSGTNFGVYTFSSTATMSPLYASSGSAPAYPPNLSGLPLNLSYGWAGNGPITTSVSNNFNCSVPNAVVTQPSIPSSGNYGTTDEYYIAQSALYRYLDINDSIKDASGTLKPWYNGLAGSSFDKFAQAERKFIVGDLTSARALYTAITPTNNIETNYKTYYGLYYTYANSSFAPTNGTDETNLRSLANGCPSKDGACVYQARALYNSVFGTASNYPICSTSGARIANFGSMETTSDWSINLYPNPATHEVSITSNQADQILEIIIADLTGRVVLNKTLKLNGFTSTVEIGLINGAYLVTLASQQGQMTKKLIVEK